MKITGIETIPFRIALKKVTVWARGKQDAAEHVLVKVHTDAGITGIAEAPPRPTIYGESIASIKFAIDKWLSPLVVGTDPFEIEKMWDKFDLIAANNTAKGAMDIALYDIMGKALGVPCYKLAGAFTNTVRLSWCVNLNPVEKMVEEGQEMMEKYGIRTMKLKVGIEPKKDLEMVKAMRHALGDDVVLYVDANQGYDPFTAVRMVEQMMEYNIAMIEEPCPVWDISGRQMVAARIPIPWMGDESCPTPPDAKRQIEAGARVISIKTARTGFTQSRRIIHLCEVNGVRNVHGLQGDTGIGSIASAHVCAGYKNTSFYYPSEASFFLIMEDDLLQAPLVVKNGCLKLSDKPGLGVEIDDAKLRKYAIES